MAMKPGLACQLLFLMLTCNTLLFGQREDTTVTFNPMIDDITLRIPPMQDLIDSAMIHSYLLKGEDAKISINKYEIKSARREWLSNLYLDAAASSDLYDGLTNNSTNQGDNSSILSYQSNFRYLLGVSIRMPMDDLYDHRNRVKTATKRLELSIAEKENLRLELRKEIILRYNQLVINQRILKIANENQTYTSLQKDMGEKEFLNGQVTLFELARITEMQRKAVTDFETARIEFYNAYMILQEIVGIKFNVINKIE
jgi:outer membrane protein TolC